MARFRGPRADPVVEARALTGDAQVADLRAKAAKLRADPGLTPEDDLRLGIALALALANCEQLTAARAELEDVRPRLPHVSPLAAADFQMGVGICADRSDDAVANVLLALRSVESVTEPSRDFALILRNSSMRLATAGMFPRAIEVAERAASVAAAAGCPPGSWKQAVGYAHIFQAMQLEHLGEDALARASWLDAKNALGDALADPQLSMLPGAVVLANRALALSRLGEADEARRSLEESRNMPVRSVTTMLRRRQSHTECSVLIAERRLEDARRLLTVLIAEGSAERDSPLVRDAEFLLSRIADSAGDGPAEQRRP